MALQRQSDLIDKITEAAKRAGAVQAQVAEASRAQAALTAVTTAGAGATVPMPAPALPEKKR